MATKVAAGDDAAPRGRLESPEQGCAASLRRDCSGEACWDKTGGPAGEVDIGYGGGGFAFKVAVPECCRWQKKKKKKQIIELWYATYHPKPKLQINAQKKNPNQPFMAAAYRHVFAFASNLLAQQLLSTCRY